ncbi:MAG: ACP S-malonyltransferase [Candidatus Methylacidiphilales bacterium]
MKKTALLFAGQGAQYPGMGNDLAEASPTAASLFEESERILGGSFRQVCFEGPDEILTRTDYCQPALYVHGLALWGMVRERFPSFEPFACAGLSLGEFTAHTAAGHCSFVDGLRLVHTRGRLMQEACEATEGGMLTLIGATIEQARDLAAQSGLEVANVNTPGQIVLSGAKNLIPAAVEQGKALGLKRVLPLNVAGAYHSRLMASAKDGLEPALLETTFLSNATPVYANVNAEPATDPETIRALLLQQVTGSVLWQHCIENMVRDGVEQFLELGPKNILANMCKRICPEVPCLSAGTAAEINQLPSLL